MELYGGQVISGSLTGVPEPTLLILLQLWDDKEFQIPLASGVGFSSGVRDTVKGKAMGGTGDASSYRIVRQVTLPWGRESKCKSSF
jgi:hypothetical protein